MENKDLNKEVERTLESLEGVQRATAGDLLYEKVMLRLENKEARVISIAPRLAWSAAAGLALLITLNVFVWLRSNQPAGTQAEQKNPLAQEYFSYLNNTIQF